MADWIQGAIRRPGALHRALGVPEGQKIPVARIEKAAEGSGVNSRRASLALTLRRINSK